MNMTTLMQNASAAIMIVMVANTQPVNAEILSVPAASVVLADAETPNTIALGPETPEFKPTVQDVLLYVCKARGYGQECAQTLLGMLWNESSNVYNVIGDHGAARGYFQIHYKLHKISTDCAEDIVCSANWTITYMESHGYPNYVTWAVQCHNSCGVHNGYAAKAFRNGAYFWDKPLTLTQSAPLDLTQVTVKTDTQIAMK